jgi:hypothetical protein
MWLQLRTRLGILRRAYPWFKQQGRTGIQARSSSRALELISRATDTIKAAWMNGFYGRFVIPPGLILVNGCCECLIINQGILGFGAGSIDRRAFSAKGRGAMSNTVFCNPLSVRNRACRKSTCGKVVLRKDCGTAREIVEIQVAYRGTTSADEPSIRPCILLTYSSK